MDAKVTRRDLELMETLAEHRVLTALMLATIRGRNVRALRRRLAALIDLGLLVADRRYQRAPRGRPERMISVSAAGVDLLKDHGILDSRAPTERATRPASRHLRHLMMMNELRAQLSQIPRIQTEMSVRFLSTTSPFLPTWAKGRPITYDRFRAPDGHECSLIPDGVLALSHATLEKTLLFFVEIDTGSEPVTSPRGHRGSLWHKLVSYQAYYGCDVYKRYEKIWDCQLRRFRVLMLAGTRARAAAISRLLRDVGTADFVLVADRENMLTCGVWSAIWRAGGKLGQSEISILGSQLPRQSPSPPSS